MATWSTAGRLTPRLSAAAELHDLTVAVLTRSTTKRACHTSSLARAGAPRQRLLQVAAETGPVEGLEPAWVSST
jgi:hypothetical protein